jgi:prophage regulatory protein
MPLNFYRLDEVLSISRLSRASIYRLISLGLFPKPVKLGLRSNGWRVADVQAWLDSRKLAS